MTRPWEECRGIGGSFGYNRAENLEDYAGSASLVHLLIEKVARGGNLLLDIGPAADGTIPVIMQQRLRDIGAWLKLNGEAIYGSHTWDKAPVIEKGATRFFTKKGNDLYLLCTTYPNEPLTIENIGSPKRVSLLGVGAAVQSKRSGKKTVITPPVLPAAVAGQPAWVFKVEGVL